MTPRTLSMLLAALLIPVGSATAEEKTVLEKLLRGLGLTVSPTQLRAPGDEVDAGDIWVVALGGAPVAVTSGGGHRSPLFAPDGSLLALKGDTVVGLGSGQAAVPLPAPGVIKLVGIDPARPDEVVVLVDGPAPLASLSLKTGKRVSLPFAAGSDADQRVLAQIRGQERIYGSTSVYVQTESRRGLTRALEWTEVYLRRGSEVPRNVSACDGVPCGQPSLSPDGRRVAFVKAGG